MMTSYVLFVRKYEIFCSKLNALLIRYLIFGLMHVMNMLKLQKTKYYKKVYVFSKICTAGFLTCM